MAFLDPFGLKVNYLPWNKSLNGHICNFLFVTYHFNVIKKNQRAIHFLGFSKNDIFWNIYENGQPCLKAI